MPRPPLRRDLFIDRSLGKFVVPNALRGLGRTDFSVIRMADKYKDDGQFVRDWRWLRYCGREQLVVLTKDEAILRRPEEREELLAWSVRVFGIGNQSLTGPEMALRYTRNINRVMQRAQKPGPYVYLVEPAGLTLKWRGRARPAGSQ